MSHYEERLEADLTTIRHRLEDLAEQVETALQNAKLAILGGDNELAYLTVLGDNPINRNSRKLDSLCHAFIARHLPSAGHLRLMSSIVRVNVALERIGDYAVTICREAARLSRPPEGAIAKHLQVVAGESQDLLKQSVSAFNEENSERARALMPMTARVEKMMDGVYDELIEGGGEREPRELVAVFVVFNLLKRISDQAKNICDQTVFAVDGQTKPQKFFRVLFVDADNACHSQMASAIANKRFAEHAHFESAGREPAAAINPAVIEFLSERGVNVQSDATQSVNALELNLASFHLIIGLGESPADLVPEMPFHTSGLRWELDPLPADSAAVADALQNMYRDLATRLDDLMEILVGEHGQ